MGLNTERRGRKLPGSGLRGVARVLVAFHFAVGPCQGLLIVTVLLHPPLRWSQTVMASPVQHEVSAGLILISKSLCFANQLFLDILDELSKFTLVTAVRTRVRTDREPRRDVDPSLARPPQVRRGKRKPQAHDLVEGQSVVDPQRLPVAQQFNGLPQQ